MTADGPSGPVPGDDQPRQPQPPPAGQNPPSYGRLSPTRLWGATDRPAAWGGVVGRRGARRRRARRGRLPRRPQRRSEQRARQLRRGRAGLQRHLPAGLRGRQGRGYAAGPSARCREGRADGARAGRTDRARAGQAAGPAGGLQGRHQRRGHPGARRLHDVGARGTVRRQGQGRLGLRALPDLEPHPDAARHRLRAVP